MNCKFYIDKCIVIEYMSNENKMCKIITNFIRKPIYIDSLLDFDCMLSDKYKNYTRKQNKYTKSIYDNKLWINNSYKKKYEKKIKKCFHDINTITKIYKSVESLDN